MNVLIFVLSPSKGVGQFIPYSFFWMEFANGLLVMVAISVIHSGSKSWFLFWSHYKNVHFVKVVCSFVMTLIYST